MSKFTKILQYVLLALSAVVVALFYVQNSSGNFALENITWVMDNTSMVDGIIWWTYTLLLVSIALVVILSIAGLANDTSSLKRTGFTLLLAIVVIGISYLFASGDPVVVNIDEQPTYTTLKMTDTGLMLTYLLLAAAILSIVGGSVMRIIKNR